MRRLGDDFRSHVRRDWTAFESLLSTDLVVVSHRTLGWPLHDRASLLESNRLHTEQVPDVAHVLRTLEVRGGVALLMVETSGHSADGSHFSWPTWSVSQSVAGLIMRMEIFDIEDEAAARARFEELASADPRTPHVDNRAIGVARRGGWLMSNGEPGRLVEMTTDDIEMIDRRQLISLPPMHGQAEMQRAAEGLNEFFGLQQIEPLAVRGHRLGLALTTFTAPNGFLGVSLTLLELDEAGLASRYVEFDETDLPAALAELEERHRLIEGDAYTDADRCSPRSRPPSRRATGRASTS